MVVTDGCTPSLSRGKEKLTVLYDHRSAFLTLIYKKFNIFSIHTHSLIDCLVNIMVNYKRDTLIIANFIRICFSEINIDTI